MKAFRQKDFLLSRQQSSINGIGALQKQGTMGSIAMNRLSLSRSTSIMKPSGIAIVETYGERESINLHSKSSDCADGIDLNSSLQSSTTPVTCGINHDIHFITKCIDFLTENHQKIIMNPILLTELETIVTEMTQAIGDPELTRILKEHSWTGAHFRSVPPHQIFDPKSCLHSLSNYYLKIHQVINQPIRMKLMKQVSIASVGTTIQSNDVRILDQIRPYLPNLLVDYLKENPIRKGETSPRVISFTGACVLADISGFSKFSGAMCSKGVSGLDELRETTSVFLGEFVKCVYEYDGDVIAFAGDALICVFPKRSHHSSTHVSIASNTSPLIKNNINPEDIVAKLEETESNEEFQMDAIPIPSINEPLKSTSLESEHSNHTNNISDCCYRAMQCGHLLRRKKTNKLSAHIGISYGDMKLAMLGGYNNKWTYVLNGECVSELSSCIDDAPAQHLAVTSACYENALEWQRYIIENKHLGGLLEDDLIEVDSQKQSGNYLIKSIGVRSVHGKKDDDMEDIQIGFHRQESYDSTLRTPHDLDISRHSDIYRSDNDNSRDGTPTTIDKTLEMMSSPTGSHFDAEQQHQTTTNKNNSKRAKGRGAFEERKIFVALPTQGLAPPVLDSPILKPSSSKSPVRDVPLMPPSQPSIQRFDLSRSSSRNFSISKAPLLKAATIRFQQQKQTPDSIQKDVNTSSIAQVDKELIFSISPFVPRPVLNAIHSESLELVGELRQVTTLFLKLVSYSASIHCDPTTLQGFFLIAQKVLHESGGYLRQFLVDDKGCVLIAMWGVPTFTYSNNATRALYSAIKIIIDAEELDHKCSIGITTGTAFCGSEGAQDRRDYAGIGSDVNMAARLMAKAHGRILVDNRSYENMSIEAQQLLKPGEQMFLKGMDGATRPYVYTSPERIIPQIISADYSHGNDNSVLRRSAQNILDNELDKLCNTDQMVEINEELLTGTAEVTSRFIFVMGMAGAGKSLAASYYRTEARKRCVNCVYVTARQEMRGVPYGIIRELFLELVGHENLSTNEQKRLYINALVEDICVMASDEDRRHARISLMEILGIDISEEDEMTNDDDESDSSDSDQILPGVSSRSKPVSTTFSVKKNTREFGDCTFYNVVGFLLASKPTVIIIENAHYADELSWDELQLLQVGTSLSISVLLTMQASKAPKSRPISVMQAPLLDSIVLKHEHGILPINNIDEKESMEPSPFSASSSTEPHRRPTEIAALENHIKNTVVAELLEEEKVAERKTGMESRSTKEGASIFNRFSRAGTPKASSRAVVAAESNTQDEIVSFDDSSVSDKTGKSKSPRPESILIDSCNSQRYIMQNAPQSWFQMLEDENTIILQLGELSKSEIREELTRGMSFKSAAKTSDQLVKLVHDVSAGNAFWCRAIANFIKEKGAAHFEQALSNFDSREQALQQLVLIRFETLSTELKLLMKYASIIGDEFSQRILLAVIPKKFQSHIKENLQLLVEKGFLRCVSEQVESIYCFQHPVIRNCIYELSTPSDKAGIHLAIAEYIEKAFRDQLRYYYPTLGFHFKCSGMKRASAFKYEIKAADQAVCGGAFFDGLAFLKSSFSLVKRRAELHLVIDVADRAVEDIAAYRKIALESQGGFSIFHKTESFSGEGVVLNGYNLVRRQAEGRLKELEEERRKKNDGARKAMMQVRPSSRGLTWQLSYVAGHRMTARPASVANAQHNRHSFFSHGFFASQKAKPQNAANARRHSAPVLHLNEEDEDEGEDELKNNVALDTGCTACSSSCSIS